MSQHDFPADLVAAEQQRQEALLALRQVPPRPWTDAAGTVHRADTGWTPDDGEREARLWERLRELSITVGDHPHWSERGDDVVAARMRLKQLAGEGGSAEPADAVS
ncbi:hypothetical protein [Streptomyces zhaozhouensis]|uniref:hypothetical protein n=1 Tax=Streptomyces zhaozhouensis TaxID=1300267 RepID=UPI000BE27507|nr:hypothetical protein [Streptomyces zhaozhouensis]